MLGKTSAALLSASLVTAAKYEEYILAPSSRALYPVSVRTVNGTVVNAESVTGNNAGNASFQGPSAVTFDMGKNVAGIVTLNVGNVDPDQYIGITFSESSLWISGEGSDATADAGIDETLWLQPTGSGDISVAPEHERGGFRYLSLIHNTTGNVEVQRVQVHFTPMPHYAEDQLQSYTGWFHCDDELINRVWYAGAYTNQMCTIDPHRGDALVHLGKVNSSEKGDDTPPNTWYNNHTITNGSSALVDGAKRDRLVWAGDMSIAVPGIVVSTNDIITVANSLDSLFDIQNKTTGQLPWAGRPFTFIPSVTYHLYTLIGVADHYLYSGSLDYLQGKWADWKLALHLSLSLIDDSGMMNVTGFPNDWLRVGMGGHNIEANSILYYTIYQGIMLGQAVGEEQSLLDSWQSKAEGIKKSANTLLWNSTTGLFHDNETTTLSPQDGNSWAVVANLTTSSNQSVAISQALQARWGDYGAPAPEAGGTGGRSTVSSFISGFELQTHFLAAQTSSALDLIRLQWGNFMLDDPRMTNSTFIEGYSFDGSLHYAPYTNDPRVSHAHGWATGPTSSLTIFVGGWRLQDAGGKQWALKPQLGDLKTVDVGFATSLGVFEAVLNGTGVDGAVTGLTFSAPTGTIGSVELQGVRSGILKSGNGTMLSVVNGKVESVPGGTWILVMANGTSGYTGSGPSTKIEPQTGGAVVKSVSLLAAVFGLTTCFM